MGTSLNRTSALYLRNNSGQTVTKGDVVILDKTLASAFTVTSSVALANTTIGVVLDQTQVASGQSCLVAIDGYVPVINLITGASLGDTFYLSSVAKQAQSHSNQMAGDFGQVLSAGTLPDAILWGNPNQNPSDGWIPSFYPWTYVSADGPTGIFSIPSDMTNILQPGMRVKYTQTTVKYGIITAVGAYAAGVTPITIYGGTDYTTANAAISANYYSTVKAPFGFPLSPIKWTVTVTDVTNRTQSSPVLGTWYNLGAVSIGIPIGIWNIVYFVSIYIGAGAGQFSVEVTLSTTNASESDTQFTSFAKLINDTGVSLTRSQIISLGSKTSYYLNTATQSAAITTMYNTNSGPQLAIRAECVYL
jgi:hypothetical protein